MNFLNNISNKYILNICFLTVIAILVLELFIGGALSFVNGKINNLENQNKTIETIIDKGSLESKIETLEKKHGNKFDEINNALTAEINNLKTEINSLKKELENSQRRLIQITTPTLPPLPKTNPAPTGNIQ
ncbi:MAG: hypothetical protein LBP59_04940 [Planctomycetaceae bacterium]|jgi:peptidoglycan hydrolase CwlO-like protein|nr:hypothetical protein [Planctomycetaceae bacterium]